jgi:hypothetical protein
VGLVPPSVTGTVLISAGDLSGCEWPSGQLNPYRSFQSLHPDLAIDDSVFVYQGTLAIPEISALASAQQSQALLAKGQSGPALAVAREAVVTSPDNLITQTALGDAAAIRALRDDIVDVLRAARSGDPLRENGWPARYAARRIAWHVLDHAWEMEDRREGKP